MSNDVSETFERFLVKNTGKLGASVVEEIQQSRSAGESGLAFEILVDVVYEMDVELDADSKSQLRSLAENLGRLDYVSGKITL